MIADLLVARLKLAVPLLRTVGKAADLTQAQQGAASRPLPCAYVVALGEQSADSFAATGATTQTRIPRLGVVLAVKKVRDLIGDAAGTDMDALRLQVDAALFGWLPEASYTPLLFTQGRLLGMLDSELWWMDEYTTETQRRALS